MKILRPYRMERCIGCHSCSLACARLVHKKLSWNTAGIRIASAGGLSTGFEAHVCVACNPAPCAKACPTGSLTQRKGGGVKVERDLCIRCGKCAAACPVDAIYMEPEENYPYLCIHCGRCVAFCPHGCLMLDDVDGVPVMPDTSDTSGKTKAATDVTGEPGPPVVPAAPVEPVEPVEPAAGTTEANASATTHTNGAEVRDAY